MQPRPDILWLDQEAAGGGARTNLVCVRMGAGSSFETWFDRSRSRNWDLLLNYYQPPERGIIPDAKIVTAGGLSKFSAVKTMHTSRPETFTSYRNLLFLDPDIEMNFEDVDLLFDLVEKYDLAIAQASLSMDSFTSWDITRTQNSSILRYTNFVEVMMPVFSSAAFQSCVETFDSSISSYGLDFLWSHLVGTAGGRLGVIDQIIARHTTAIDRKNGAFYKYMRSLNIDPFAEWDRVVKQFAKLELSREPKTWDTILKSQQAAFAAPPS